MEKVCLYIFRLNGKILQIMTSSWSYILTKKSFVEQAPGWQLEQMKRLKCPFNFFSFFSLSELKNWKFNRTSHRMFYDRIKTGNYLNYAFIKEILFLQPKVINV